ncbi:TLC domain-containing protein 2-like [Hydractinia symbiolongicarpus]|uniref:TLC domain-containing protein 2-like n=1 Tax=Hydractinia symbiolongicarpus TaxID=13093 RepID=UPI00254EA5B7|nr:TLC domain-containing protein 2-like [Hydractinia symbiolongicarpus]
MVAFLDVYVLNIISYVILSILIKKFTNLKYLKSKDRQKIWTWRNTLCSLMHSIVTSVMVAASFIENPELLMNFTKTFKHYDCYLATITIPASTGYFTYDFVDIVWHDQFRQWEVLSHHVAISAALLLAHFYGYYGYLLCALALEINTVNLHLRRLLRMITVQYPAITRMNIHCNAFTTILFRGIFSFVLCYGFYGDDKITGFPAVLGTICFTVMIGTNIGIMYRIYQTDYAKACVCDDKLVT